MVSTWEPILVAQLWQACGGEVNAGPPGRSPANSSNNSQFSLYCLEKCKVANFWTHTKKGIFQFFCKKNTDRGQPLRPTLWPFSLLSSQASHSGLNKIFSAFLLKQICWQSHLRYGTQWLAQAKNICDVVFQPPKLYNLNMYTKTFVRIKACGI